jgi:pyruvyltransferase
MYVVKYMHEFQWPHNFGDAINVEFYKYFMGEKNVSFARVGTNDKIGVGQTMTGIGSILKFATTDDVIFGTGLLYKLDKFPAPKQIISVRGPLTREWLISMGCECPEVYGDPVLLMPLMYKPTIDKKYKVGIIPHYIDKAHLKDQYKNLESTLIIDIQNSDYKNFIDQVLSCEHIISSSLHGVIVGDAYGIPSYLAQLGKHDVTTFKYKDYYQSVNKKFKVISTPSDLDTLVNQFTECKCTINIKKLVEIFPNIDPKIQAECFEKLAGGIMDYMNPVH